MAWLHRGYLFRSVSLLVVLVFAALAGLTTGVDRAAASHTQILFSDASTYPAPQTTVFLVKDGPARTLYVWAKDVDNATGASAFEVNIGYNPSTLTVLSITEDPTWLTSGARGQGSNLYCNQPFIEPMPGDPKLWRANASCITLDPVTVPGVTGDGLLATLVIQATPGAAAGTYQGALDFTNGTFLVETQLDPGRIPAQLLNANVLIARFADFNGDCSVSLTDVFQVIPRFGQTTASPEWDPQYDLNDNGSVDLDDVFVVIFEFGLDASAVGVTCP